MKLVGCVAWACALVACTSISKDTPRCGDGAVDPGEQCDDGNNANGDGCSSTCAMEGPAPVCGDDHVDPGEQCDDGNTTAGDGCSPSCLQENAQTARIEASWMFRNLALGTSTPCGDGYDTATMYAQELDAAGSPIGACPGSSTTCFTTPLSCPAGSGASQPLPRASYLGWITFQGTNGNDAESLPRTVDLTGGDAPLAVEILEDGGYFRVAWRFTGAVSQDPLDCAQANAKQIRVQVTDDTNPVNTMTQLFPCTDGVDVTHGFIASSYAVAVSALDPDGNEIDTTTWPMQPIYGPNQVTDVSVELVVGNM